MTLWIESRDGEAAAVRAFMAALRHACEGNKLEILWSSHNYAIGGHGQIVFTTLDAPDPQCIRLWELAQSPIPVVFRLRDPDEIVAWPEDDLVVPDALEQIQAREQFGFTTPAVMPDTGALSHIVTVLEPTFNKGLGYWVLDVNDNHIPEPLHVVIVHESTHAWELINGIFHVGDDDDATEFVALEAENEYRRLRGLTERWGHEGGYNSPSWIGNPGCFIATAAYGSASDPAVHSLRTFRDEVLLHTRHGNAYFDEFYAKYYRLSPAIVQIMHADPEFARMVRDTLVAPIVGYLELARIFPRHTLDGVPEPWRGFLESARDGFEQWSAEFPLPQHLDQVSPADAALELLVTMNSQLWRPEAAQEFIEALTAAGELPLTGDAKQLQEVAERLARDGVAMPLIDAIVGPRADEEVKRERPPDPALGQVLPRAGVHQLHVEPCECVARARGDGARTRPRVGSDVTLHRIPNFQPGAELLLPLGTQADVALYQVAMYDADGRMIGLAPSEVTGYSRADAAGNGLIVLSDTCDRVVLEPAHLVNLDLPYVVHISNETTDTWEEVTMSYGSAVDGTALFASSPVSPGGSRDVRAVPCKRADGLRVRHLAQRIARGLRRGRPAVPAGWHHDRGTRGGVFGCRRSQPARGHVANRQRLVNTRVVSGVVTDERGRIRMLLGSGDWSPVSAAEANRAIRAGAARYETSQGTAIHALRSQWVRTNPNATGSDNLDYMSGDELGQLPTGEFDLTLEVSPQGMEVLARELHASRAIVNAIGVEWEGLQISGILGPPAFTRVSDDTFSITREALCEVRTTSRIDVASVVVANLVASLTVLCTPTVRIAPGSGMAQFALGYSQVPGGGVRLLSAVPPQFAPTVVAALGGWMRQDFKDHWAMPLTGPLENASSLVASFTTTGAAVLGIGFSGTRHHHLPSVRHSSHWTLALARTLVAQNVADAVVASLGAAPAPLGTARRVAIPGAQDTFLDRLEVGLRPGEIVLRGRARKQGGPVVTVEFEIAMRLVVSTGGTIDAEVHSVSASLVEWYANVADFFSGGAISATVTSALQHAMSGITDGAGGLLDPSVLTQLMAAGSDSAAQLSVVPQRAWIEYGGIFIAGGFERAARPPTVRLITNGSRADATLTTVPGARAETVTWTVDGAVTEQVYEQRAIERRTHAGNPCRHGGDHDGRRRVSVGHRHH